MCVVVVSIDNNCQLLESLTLSYFLPTLLKI